MKSIIKLPTVRESVYLLIGLTLWLGVTALVMPMRPEHWFLAVMIFTLFCLNITTRQLVIALIPFALFGISYDWMNIWHNYEVNTNIDIAGLYNTEKAWFGIPGPDGTTLTPNEFFAIHHYNWLDLLCGIFYLCWVPVPMAFGIWLFFKHQRTIYLHFALVFLLVNLIGFTIYYIHPAVPPWYVEMHGFAFDPSVHGEVAGLGRFDQMTGLNIFESIYTRNSNVFAALPSLHSAYMPTALYYSFRAKCPVWMRILLAVLSLGIWFTAVYSSHHYIIDVLSGIGCTIVGILLFEGVLMHIKPFSRFISRYSAYIS